MTSKVGGRLALIFAAGVIAYFGGPLHAALKSSAANAPAAQTSWLGDTLSASDIINLKPIAGGKVASAGSPRPIVVAQAQMGQGQMVTPDQLSDVDRALAGGAARTTVGVAPTTRRIVRVAPIIVASPSDAWDQTSLIGKIFVGIGACLTLASAARMFIA
ncbi:MAG TPA: hypothetical protein VMM15_04280 [Bradyrhizobium sp.]|nr:hypothetical protein [Bradyrhizobium sp.]